jgi:hypothetical protein
VVALQRADELAPILTPLRRWPGVRLIELPVCEAVQSPLAGQRRAYRAACYRDYFANSARTPCRVKVLPSFPIATSRRTISRAGKRRGFVLALALVDSSQRHIHLAAHTLGRAKAASARCGWGRCA